MLKILVVEDEFVSRKLMRQILLPYGKVDVAVNGKEAVEVVRSAIQASEPYDLICLDIMTGVSGLDIKKSRKALSSKGLSCHGL